MTVSRFLLWFALTGAAFIAVTLVQRPLRGKGGKTAAALFAGKLLAAAAIAFLIIAWSTPLSWKLCLPLGAVYLALLGDGLGDLFRSLRWLFRRRPWEGIGRLVPGLLITAVLLCYGTVNMQTILPNEQVYTSEKLRQSYTVVFLSDLHFGSPQTVGVVERALGEIEKLAPDYLLLGGDITDEYTTREEMEQIYARIGAMGLPTYYVYGNHDRQPDGSFIGGQRYSPEELEEAIRSSGIAILRDSFVRPEEDLVFLGREDVSAGEDRLAVRDLPPLPRDAFTLCVDHSPYQLMDIAETKADLQLSGHTHAGQLFPLRFLYRPIVKVPYGAYRIGDTDLYVSAGMGGWYLPLRTEAHCYYEVIRLRPEA